MARKTLDELEPGMILRKDVAASSGQILLKAETVIENKHLKIFKTWGITNIEVIVEGEEEACQFNLAEIPESIVEDVRQSIQSCFQYVDLEHPLMQILFHLRLCKDVQEKTKGGSHEI